MKRLNLINLENILFIILSIFIFLIFGCELMNLKPILILNNDNVVCFNGDYLKIYGRVYDPDDDVILIKGYFLEDQSLYWKGNLLNDGKFLIEIKDSNLFFNNSILREFVIEAHDTAKNIDIKKISIIKGLEKYVVTRNSFFSKEGFYDNPIIMYENISDIENYLNKNSGDYIPDWFFYVPATTQLFGHKPSINIGSGYINIKANYAGGSGTEIGFYQNLNYKINDKTKLIISLKINNMGSGNFPFGFYFERTIKVQFKINNINYTIAMLTDSANTSSYDYHPNLIKNIPLSQKLTFVFSLYNKESFYTEDTSQVITLKDQILSELRIRLHTKGNFDVTFYGVFLGE